MGVVYRAFDRELGVEVALKTLNYLDANSLFRFKNEFRALADVSHPNLVSLHDMECSDQQWFFTMELVEGVDFLAHVRGESPGLDLLTSSPTISSDTRLETPTRTTIHSVRDLPARADTPAPVASADQPVRPPDDVLRLRNALRQLAHGVHALHQSGHLHRDIKPSNIRVSDDGRVVLLDFGIITALADSAAERGDSAGTPAYMSPEQAREEGTSAASDWYSVGVVLFQALTGQLPFSGADSAVILSKQSKPAPAPRHLWSDAPPDLDELCVDLLRIDPDDRPSGDQVLAALGGGDVSIELPAGAVPRAPLVGRRRHLEQLRDAVARSQNQCVALLVAGESGMGKTELVQQFLAEQPETTVVLRGRCYEKESVPYKAVDSLIDSLSRYLAGLPGEQIEALLPPDAAMLCRMFPVLGQVAAFKDAADDAADEDRVEPQQLRQRACIALRELLSRCARDRSLILFVDDLQWGDPDSAPVIDSIIRPPDPPPLLLLGSFRSDEQDRSGLLRALFSREATLGEETSIERLEVGPLERTDAVALARSLVGSADVDSVAEWIADESRGNPFLLTELARFSEGRLAETPPSLAEMIGARLDELEPPVRRLVEVTAVAGRPVEQRIAKDAASVDDSDWAQVVQKARASHLLRLSGTRGGDLIECYHDRIREGLADGLDPETLRDFHQRLAAAIEATPRRDPEILAEHLIAAGDPSAAARYVVAAAEQAARALAFDRAASQYRRALDLGDPDDLELRVRLAETLVNDGRGAEGAAEYLVASQQASGSRSLDLRRLAAEQFLRSGHVDRGLDVLGEVLDELGMKLPASPWRAVPAILWQLLVLRLRGLRYRPRKLGEIGHSERLRLDACRTAVTGLALIDPVRAAKFATRGLLLALRAGEPRQLALNLANQAVFFASAKDPRRATELMNKADEIAATLGDPQIDGHLAMVRAVMTYEQGEFAQAQRRCERAEQLLEGHCTGVAWELRTVQLFHTSAMMHLGRFRELEAKVPALVEDARRRGDLYAITNMRAQIVPPLFAVIRDDVEYPRAVLDEAEREWTSSGFYMQHLFILFMRTFTDLYDGRGIDAHDRCQQMRRRLSATLLLEDRSVRTFWDFLCGASAVLAASQSERRRRRCLRIAARFARKLVKDGAAPYRAMASTIQASIAFGRGRHSRGLERLRAAVGEFDAADMHLFAQIPRRRLGLVVGGDEGSRLVAAADEVMLSSGVANPPRLADGFCPSFSPREGTERRAARTAAQSERDETRARADGVRSGGGSVR